MNLSVIIPTYNRKQILKYVILSLMNQDVKEYEVLICDDGSNDGTDKEIEELKKNFSLPFELNYFRQDKKGFRAAAARNLGIINSKGEKIIFMDQDIIASPNVLKKIIENLQETYFCYGSLKMVPLIFFEENITDEILLNNFNVFEKQHHGIIRSTLSSFGIIYRKDIEKIRTGMEFFDEDFEEYGLEDSELMKRLNDVCVKSFLNPKIICYHIEHDYEKHTVSRSMQDRFHHKINNSSHDGKKVIL